MKRTRIRPISAKRKKQLLAENELKRKLYIKQNGKCKKCGQPLETDIFGWDKHEIIKRSQGGDPLDENNCELLHRLCHGAEHGINIIEHKEV